MEKNSKKSIIIGVTSLLLVTLLLVGLTYAYYRTRIIGNESTSPSISVQSKKMEIVYEDGDSSMNMTGKIEPGFTASKTFYVKNTGSETVKYSVILDEMTNDFNRNQDWQVTLTKNGTEVISAADNKYLAVGRHQVLLPSESIVASGTETPTTDTYVLTVIYKKLDDVNQSEDMGMNLSFKVNIAEESYSWDSAPEGSLLFALKNNQPSGSETTTPGQAVSTANEKRILTTEDDYGTSYVYRGAVENNYVNYSGMCWRVLRVQGDGTIKLALANAGGECDVDDYYKTNLTLKSSNNLVYENSLIPTKLNTWATDTNLDTSKLAIIDWCSDTSIFDDNSYGWDGTKQTKDKESALYWFEIYGYGANGRLSNTTIASPTLKCNMKGLNDSKATRFESNIGILNADEVVFAGSAYSLSNSTFYLYKDYSYLGDDVNPYDFNEHLMTPFYYDSDTMKSDTTVFELNGNIYGGAPSTQVVIRPVIALKSSVLATYDAESTNAPGTHQNPYVIE